MKIANEHVARLLEARLHRLQQPASAPTQPRPAPAQRDRATFSSVLDDLRAGLAAAKASRGGGNARLSSLAAQIRTGQYRVPAAHIAEALARDLRGI